ncbi:MAG TPA: iron-sulfur cluster assembly accessory protein [Candidatus Acidoferrales bacterium]|nr:iron-sulfur cluster assembly accessory protein [Candidatus Acidoferrales bacterium]
MARSQEFLSAAAQAPLVSLTEKAANQVKMLLEREQLDGYGLRIGVTPHGCSGFSYVMDFEHEEKPGDVVSVVDGVKIYINEQSARLLKGTVIDYVSGLQGAGFKFHNPNATGACGCGSSFSA